LVSGRKLLDEWVDQAGLRVWVCNHEDTREEMDRRGIGAMIFHGIKSEKVEGKLFLDTGRERPLRTAVDTFAGVTIVKPEIDEPEVSVPKLGRLFQII